MGTGNDDAGGNAVSNVLVVPDLFGSGLRATDELIWVSADAITDGRLGEIRYPDDGDHVVTVDEPIEPGGLHSLQTALGKAVAIEPVPYDWRGGIEVAAAATRDAVQAFRTASPKTALSVVGHGLGALGILALATGDADWLAGLAGGRVVLVAPPLEGSEAVLQIALGKGPLFNMLTRLDDSRTATEVLRLFLTMPGIVDLLPTRALSREWWDDLALTAPAERMLEAAKTRRDSLQVSALSNVGSVLLGAASETIAYEGNDDEDLEIKRYTDGDGDGWMRNPAASVPSGCTWYVAALHERLIADPTGARAIADLARSGTTERAATTAPTEELPERAAIAVERPEQKDLLASLTAAGAQEFAGEPSKLRVRVAHGSLDRLALPVAVGHYVGDAIFGAEAFLDRCLGGRLKRRHRLGQYPGKVGSTLVVSAPGCSPPGGLVIGLGEVGELNAGRLSIGFEKAVLQLALQAMERRFDKGRENDPVESLSFATLLIGTRGGRQLSVRQAIVATLRGVLSAKRILVREGFDSQVRVEDLVFVELWADVANVAGHALAGLGDDPNLGLLRNESIETETTLLVSEGGRSNRLDGGEDWSWWRRMIVSEEKNAAGGADGLRFVSLSERARAEDRLLSAQRALVDQLLERAPKSISEVAEGSVVNALFELLLPVALKDSVFDGSELVLVLDRPASRYPWELLARRKGGGVEPLVSRVKLLRQFRTTEFRETILPARSNQALVIGEPKVRHVPPLDAAVAEGREVVSALTNGGFEVVPSIEEDGSTIVEKFFLHDYRVVHIAAHGSYDAGSPERTGVLIGHDKAGNPRMLSAAVFSQLRAVPEVVFLNCCHLGRTDQPTPDGPNLAASVAEALIGLGVKCVLAAGWAVNDKAGLAFARTFYGELLSGRPYGDAVHAARNVVWDEYSHTTTWGAYQCYGDPTFELRKPQGGWTGKQQIYVSETELKDAIADVAARATNTGDSTHERQTSRERLRSIEDALERHRDWGEGGALLFQLAEAWKQVGEHEKAVVCYRQALRAWDGLAPLRAAEQLANLLERYGRGRLVTDELTEVEQVSKRDGTPLSQAWIEWASRVGRTPERAAILGGFFKRKAQALSGDERRAALTRSATAYGEAVQMIRAKRDETPYYQGINAVAVAWAAQDLTILKEAKEWLAASRDSADAEEKRQGLNLWTQLAKIEADLLEALIDKRLNQKYAKDLKRRYEGVLSTLGSIHDRDSARKQLDFLIDCASPDRGGSVKALKIIQAVFSDKEN